MRSARQPAIDSSAPLAWRLRRGSAALRAKVLDEVRFLRTWAEKPLLTGALVPSSPLLARLMAAYADPAAPGLVLELGPGTGAMTKALLERGIAPERLISVEYNPDFCRLLQARYPDIRVIQGDAYALGRTLGRLAEPPFAAIVSSLPLLTKPLAARAALLDEALGLLAPGAPFVQFSYGLAPPVPARRGSYEIEKTNWVMMNLPPARVWVYRRSEGRRAAQNI